SADKSLTTFPTDAPNTFLTPISFFRRCAVKMDKPKRPRQATKIERNVKMRKTAPICCSERYNASKSLSRKLKSNGVAGAKFCQTVFILPICRLIVPGCNLTETYEENRPYVWEELWNKAKGSTIS